MGAFIWYHHPGPHASHHAREKFAIRVIFHMAELYRVIAPRMEKALLTSFEHAVLFSTVVALCFAMVTAINRFKRDVKSIPSILSLVQGS